MDNATYHKTKVSPLPKLNKPELREYLTKNNVTYDIKDTIPKLHQKLREEGIINKFLLVASIINKFN